MTSNDLESWFYPDGPIAEVMDSFEKRTEQIQMAQIIHTTLMDGGHAVIEGGTGTGKTLAYLIPIALEKRPAIISTGTIALQEQLLHKDLPILQRAGLHLNAHVLKGRRNYACLLKAKQGLQQLPLEPQLRERFTLLLDWLKETTTGDRSDLPENLFDPNLWRFVRADAETCTGPECQYFNDCFLYQARRIAEKSDIVIVNHHLLITDLYLKTTRETRLLPNHPCLIVDEAHLLEDAAVSCLSMTLNYRELVRLIDHLAERVRQFAPDLNQTVLKHGERLIGELRHLALEIFHHEWPDNGDRLPWRVVRESPDVLNLVALLTERLTTLAKLAQKLPLEEAERPLLERWFAAMIESAGMFTPDAPDDLDAEWVRFVERSPELHAPYHWQFVAAPADVKSFLPDLLWDEFNHIVLLSATIRVQGNFDFFLNRLGLDPERSQTAAFPSPFDWRQQCRLWIPDDIPEPGHPNYLPETLPRLRALIELVGGKSLVLCTSYRNLFIIRDYLRDQLPFTILSQGKMSKKELLDRFQNDVDSVLVATASFWQGVDIPGEALSCLIIDKIPFDVPSDPLIEVQVQRFRSEGLNPFHRFQLPRALLLLRQGLGRLIRHQQDRGIMALFDSRIWHRSYGRLILNELKPIPITRDFKALQTFWSSVHSPSTLREG